MTGTKVSEASIDEEERSGSQTGGPRLHQRASSPMNPELCLMWRTLFIYRLARGRESLWVPGLVEEKDPL